MIPKGTLLIIYLSTEMVMDCNIAGTIRQIPCKKAGPDLTMGFNSMFRYKKFDFSFNGRISLGNYVYTTLLQDPHMLDI